MNLRTTVLPLTAVLLLTAGCTSEGAEPDGSSASAATSAPPATPSPSADGILEESDPQLGIVLVDPPALTGPEADVYDTVALYEKAYWSTMTTNEVHPLLDVVAAPELKAVMEQVAATNVGISADIGGTYQAQISDVRVGEDGAASAVMCSDYSTVTFADPEGTYPPGEVGYGERRRRVYTLRQLEASWQVVTDTRDGTC